MTTSKPSTMSTPGKQKIKAYYTNDEYDINTWVTYDIEIIDWTIQDKAIFSETSLSSLAGAYYPMMEGMKVVTETDPVTGVIDYWIELENGSKDTILEYCYLLDEYEAKKTVTQNGNTYTITFKFYEQRNVPLDFRQIYGSQYTNTICFKYCASYEYIDMNSGGVYNLYANDVEDTLVIGLDKDNKMIVRYIVNSVKLENVFMAEVNERLTLNDLLFGATYTAFKKSLLGYDNEEGQHAIGIIEENAPLALDYFIMPDVEPEVFAMGDYSCAYPWLHGEDDCCFEITLPATQAEHDEFVTKLDAKDSFVKTTRVDKMGTADVGVTIYTIENKDYVGNLTIEVTDYIVDALTYTITRNGRREEITTGIYNVYYRFQAPEVFSPTLDELYRIYEVFYGENNYSKTNYDRYEAGGVGGIIKFNQFKQTTNHPTKDDNEVENKEEAFDKFIATALTGYACVKAAETITVNGIEVYSATYSNSNYTIEIYAYFAGNGKFAVEFKIDLNRQ